MLAPLSSNPSAPVYLVSAGRQECSDRVVFHLNGPDPTGYSVRYVDLVREDGSGRPVPVAGAAALQVVINAPALGQDSHGYVGKVLAQPEPTSTPRGSLPAGAAFARSATPAPSRARPPSQSASASESHSVSSPCSIAAASTAAWS
jgi:hypothetical protein